MRRSLTRLKLLRCLFSTGIRSSSCIFITICARRSSSKNEFERKQHRARGIRTTPPKTRSCRPRFASPNPVRALGACGRNEHARKGVSAMRLQACGVEMGSSGDLHGQDSTVSAEAPFPPKKSAELRQFLSIVIPSRLQDIVRRGAEARGFAAHGRLFFGLLLVLIAATGFVFKEQICPCAKQTNRPCTRKAHAGVSSAWLGVITSPVVWSRAHANPPLPSSSLRESRQASVYVTPLPSCSNSSSSDGATAAVPPAFCGGPLAFLDLAILQ